MTYSVFPQNDLVDNTQENMFFGSPVAVARYDKFRHGIFDKLTEKQLSFFWRPEEVDVSQDRIDFQALSDAEKHVLVSNLKYQTLLDSVQGRSPNMALLPIVSIPELETWIETWSFSETIHSRSYTHILRNVFVDPSFVFDDITNNAEIQKRAKDVSKYYDDLIFHVQVWQTHNEKEGTFMVDGKEVTITMRDLKKKLYLCVNSVNALEAIRFYVSFACTFAFSEMQKMEGNGKILRLIARDEALHLTSTQHIINLWRLGADDPEMAEIARECEEEAKQIFMDAVEQEKEWADYLFKDGSMIGLNKEILCQYVDYIAHKRLEAIGIDSGLPKERTSTNPLPWMSNYLESDNVQVAPQEAEIASYLVSQIDADVDNKEFEDFDL